MYIAINQLKKLIEHLTQNVSTMNNLINRTKELNAKITQDMSVKEKYEEDILMSLHSISRVSNTPLRPLPNYDGLEDLMNIQSALNDVQALLTQDIKGLLKVMEVTS